MRLSALLHCQQPFRKKSDVTYIPLKEKYSNKIYPETLIPNLYVINPEEREVDYNDKITQQSYSPCAGRNVYQRLPFNISPSLLKDLWIRQKDVHDKIVESEKQSCDRFGGHSNAIAQASPNHVIMPLAKDKDKLLYILWSIEEYEKHFNKFPEGMWLPETAVDKRTLSVLAELGIKYVVLNPRQAKRIRPIFNGENGWQSIEGGTIDISKTYKVYFEDSKKEIAVFFYDKGFSGSLGFPDKQNEWIYHNADNFLARWLSIPGRFKHFAVDGETFGHHKPQAAELLGDSLDLIERNPFIELTNYGQYLEENPPQFDVDIIDNSSWSCEHGLVRWGKEFHNEHDNCREGSLGSEWRVEMRRAFDKLAMDLDAIFLKHAPKYYKDPRKALEDYGSVVAGKQTFYEFFDYHGKKGLSDNQLEKAYALMEMQKFKLYMFTSCGWFHDYVKRPEPLANFMCAYSAIQIAKQFEPRSKIKERFLLEPKGEMLNRIPDKYYGQARLDMIKVYKDAETVINSNP